MSVRVRAALGAVLDDFAVFFCRLDELPALKDIVAKRLFDIHVLAGLACPDGGQRVPMVGRRDRDGVDVLVGERFANVAIQLGPLALGVFDDLRPSLEHLRIGIAERDVFGFILLFEDVFDVASPLPVEANGANANAAIYVAPGGRTGGSRGNYGSGAGRQEGSSS